MDRNTARLWGEARTLTDLGELVALWLHGRIPSQPGYMPGFGPDEETAELIPTLTALNRAGYVTDGSQPGCDEHEDGRHWLQRAAVEGFADDDTAQLLCETADLAGMIHVARRSAWRCSWRTSVPVTLLNGRRHTGFGTQLSRRHLRWTYAECNREAQRALSDAWQVTLVDPEWGRDDRLWPLLRRVVPELQRA